MSDRITKSLPHLAAAGCLALAVHAYLLAHQLDEAMTTFRDFLASACTRQGGATIVMTRNGAETRFDCQKSEAQ